jgi:hypothetical protein
LAELEDWLHLWLKERPALDARRQRLRAEQLEEELRTASHLSLQDGDDPSAGAFRFAHTSLQEFFLASYLVDSGRTDVPENWDNSKPSLEALDFLGLTLNLVDDDVGLRTMIGWRTESRPEVNLNFLAYALRALKKGWTVLPLAGIDLNACNLSQNNFENLDLSDVNFKGSTLLGAEFRGLVPCGLDFSGAKLSDIIIEGCHCRIACFDAAEVNSTAFHKSNLARATAQGARGVRPRVLLCTGGKHLARLFPGALQDDDLKPLESQLELTVAFGHSASVTGCTFSLDGKTIMSGGTNRTLRLWDSTSGETVRPFVAHKGFVTSSAFSPDG